MREETEFVNFPAHSRCPTNAHFQPDREEVQGMGRAEGTAEPRASGERRCVELARQTLGI